MKTVVRKVLALAMSSFCICCSLVQSDNNLQILNFGHISMNIPKSWKFINKNNNKAEIVITIKDTLNLEAGYFSDNLYEYDPPIIDSDMISLIDTNLTDISKIVVVKNHSSVDPDKYRKNNVIWKSIDGHKIKIVYPRQSGLGVTGIYIDSVVASATKVEHFKLYGENLSPNNESQVLKALESLKFLKNR